MAYKYICYLGYKQNVYWPVVKFCNINDGVLKVVKNDMGGEEPGIASDGEMQVKTLSLTVRTWRIRR
jgi:VIT1/CCC1 family predicted Fe2+/Mn2+ transporter